MTKHDQALGVKLKYPETKKAGPTSEKNWISMFSSQYRYLQEKCSEYGN
jgi:hypothetical protein